MSEATLYLASGPLPDASAGAVPDFSGLGFRVLGLVFNFQGLGSRVQVSGFRV